MELSATPEKAFLITNTLHVCSANQGHLLHMPSHIDMWVGQCKEAVEVNKAVDGVKQRWMMSFINFIGCMTINLICGVCITINLICGMSSHEYGTTMRYAEVVEK